MVTPHASVRNRVALRAVALIAAICGAACTTDVIEHRTLACGPDTCSGCCSSSGTCLSGESPIACGALGLACTRCGSAQTCSDGVCLSPSPPDAGEERPSCGPENCGGCCQGDVCVSGPEQSVAACGSAGAACEACTDGNTCVGGVCRVESGCKLVIAHPTDVVDFGNAVVGTSWDRHLEFVNEGTETCQISAPTWINETDTKAFRFGSTSEFEVPPGGRSKLKITFSPWLATEWIPERNAFTFVVSDGAWSQCARPEPGCRHVKVTGRAIASRLTPAWDFAQTHVDFGEVQVGCQSVQRNVLLVNASPVPKQIVSASASGSGFSLEPVVLPFDLPAWGTRSLRVRFAPGVEGPSAGRLKVGSRGGEERNVPLEARAAMERAQTTRFTQRAPADVDLLFVVHSGEGMGWVQSELEAAAPELASGLGSAQGTFQIGVLSTDATQPDSGRLKGPTPFVTPGPSAGSQLAHRLAVGVDWPAPDQALEAARLALLPTNLRLGQPNEGFLRKHARLGVVIVSNAEEKSGAPVDEYLHAFYAAKGGGISGSLQARLYALAEPAACTTGQRYRELLSYQGDACRSLTVGGIAGELESVLADLLEAQRAFAVSGPIDPTQPLSVSVDGVALPASAFTVNPSFGIVEFLAPYVPEAGQQIDVTWTPTCRP